MIRVAIEMNERGELVSVASDGEIQCLIVCPHVPRDRVYDFSVEGADKLRELVGGYAIGHAADGTLGEGDGTGKRPPSRPHFKLVT